MTTTIERPALTREQVEAMDETMNFSAHRVTQIHRRHELADHFAPGVIERHEPKRGDIGLALILGAAAGVVSLVWWVVA